MKTATIIIPTYNERENIQAVVAALDGVFSTIKEWKMNVLVVDDTSPDKTYALVEELQKKHTFLHLLINKQKSGLGGAYLKGMEHAFGKLKSDVVFEFDADLSHDPTKIPSFLEKIEQGYDLVLGSRYIAGGGIPDDWGMHRKFMSIVGNLIIMLVFTDFSIRDWTSGFRAITKQVYTDVHSEMKSDRFSGYTFQIGFLVNTIRKGYSVAEVPFKFVDREHGNSKLGAEYVKNTLLYIMKVRIQELMAHRFFKFAFVGGMGAAIQLVSLTLLRNVLPYQISFFLAIELAVLSNFLINNAWTFADRKLKIARMPIKFIQFNLASSGSIIIQQLTALIGENTLGLLLIFVLPIVNIPIDTGHAYAVIGILLGLFWNFFAYNRFIWKKK